MSAVLTSAAVQPGVAFELDGQPVTAHPGETILKAAQRHGVEIPHLCYSDGLRPDGNCRACVVEIAGERTLAPSCCRAPTEGMKVSAVSPRARKSQEMVVEMLLSDMPDQGYRWNDGDANTPELIAAKAIWRPLCVAQPGGGAGPGVRGFFVRAFLALSGCGYFPVGCGPVGMPGWQHEENITGPRGNPNHAIRQYPRLPQ
eukprot:gene31766-54127_t